MCYGCTDCFYLPYLGLSHRNLPFGKAEFQVHESETGLQDCYLVNRSATAEKPLIVYRLVYSNFIVQQCCKDILPKCLFYKISYHKLHSISEAKRNNHSQSKLKKMKKTIYQVINPFGGEEFEIDIEEVDINYIINTDRCYQFNTLEEAKEFIKKRYDYMIEDMIERYKILMINITINK